MERILHTIEEIDIAIKHACPVIVTDNQSALLSLGMQPSDERPVKPDENGYLVTKWFRISDSRSTDSLGRRQRQIIRAVLKVKVLE